MSESSEIDVPNLPFKKPVQLEQLEEMSFEQREAMDIVEMKQRIRGIAYTLVEACRDAKGNDLEACLAITHSALSEMGASLGGHFGATMVALSEKSAREAIQEIFPEDE